MIKVPHQKKAVSRNSLPALSRFSKITIFLFILFFGLGSFIGNFFKVSFYSDILSLFSSTAQKLTTLEIDRNAVFLYSFREHLKFFLLFCFFSITNVWRIYYIGAIAYTGFSNGLLFIFCLLVNGTGGILQFCCFIFPQTLCLIPFYLCTIKQLEYLHHEWFSSDHTDYTAKHFLPGRKKRQLLFSQLPLFLIAILFIAFCSLLEGYINVPLLLHYNSGL